MQAINLKKLYKLPWTKNNNPNGMIEPTTYCQLACPGCYRGLALPNPQRAHEDVNKLKKEIDTLIKIRKIKIISIAGGEPLLYPNLDEIISYAHGRRLQVRLLTNGVALTKEVLLKLKDLGVSEVVIHISEYQKRPDSNKEDLNKQREQYCQIFREVGGVVLNFIVTVSKENFHELPTLIDFYQTNQDIIKRVFFSRYQDVLFKTPEEEDSRSYISFESIVKLIKEKYQSQPCSYLGKKLDKKNPSWLFFAPIFLGEKPIGYADRQTVENLLGKEQTSDWVSFPAFKTFSSFSWPAGRKIIVGYIRELVKNPKNIFKLPRCQIVILLNTPTLTKQGWDTCEGCPHAILYKNSLVPICLLERIKAGEHIKL